MASLRECDQIPGAPLALNAPMHDRAPGFEGKMLDARKLYRGLGFLIILAALIGYAAGALQLPERESGEITVNTNPPGATIFVDGMHRGSTPLRVSGLRPGTHQLRAVMPGYKGVVLQVEVLPSKRDSLDWMLEPAVPEGIQKQLARWMQPLRAAQVNEEG